MIHSTIRLSQKVVLRAYGTHDLAWTARRQQVLVRESVILHGGQVLRPDASGDRRLQVLALGLHVALQATWLGRFLVVIEVRMTDAHGVY